MKQYIDIHSHLNFVAYEKDRDEVIKRTEEGGVATITVGTQKDTSISALSLAKKYEGIYACVGLHPIHTDKSFHDEKELGDGGKEFTSRGEVFDPVFYKQLAMDPKVVAIGECGLDYYRLDSNSVQKQKDAFIAQIALANEVGKPLMLHVRPGSPKSNEGGEAYDDAYEILKSNAKVGSNLHFFAGGIPEAKKFLDLGCSFSFTGVVTFTDDYHEVIKYLPLSRIMSETDSPYVTPAPFRGKRNEPLYVKEVVKKIAEIKGIDFETTRKQLVENAVTFFSLSF